MTNTKDAPIRTKITSEKDANKKDDALAELEEKLQHARDSHREERFVWIVIVVILLDIVLMGNINGLLSIGLLIFEVPLLIVLARRNGVEEAAQLFDGVLEKITKVPGE